MWRDRQPALGVDGGDRFGGRPLRWQKRIDEQRQQMSIGGADLFADDYVDAELARELGGLCCAGDAIVIGEKLGLDARLYRRT